MNKATDPVLEVLREAGDLCLSRADINWNVQQLPGDQPSRSAVYDAFEDLERYGLVKSREGRRTRYAITETGIRYLDEELDASKLDADS